MAGGAGTPVAPAVRSRSCALTSAGTSRGGSGEAVMMMRRWRRSPGQSRGGPGDPMWASRRMRRAMTLELPLPLRQKRRSLPHLR